MRGRRRGLALVALSAALVLLLGGCSAMRSADENGSGGPAASGSGTVVELAAEDRGEPVEVAGSTVEGDQVSITSWRGQVVVLNLWYAACGPCRAEARDLAEVSEEYADEGVRFLGINTRDGADEAAAFQRRFQVPYSSVLDTDGAAVLALRGQTVPNAVPTTLVLDRSGRVASRVTGQIDPGVLRTLIETVLAER